MKLETRLSVSKLVSMLEAGSSMLVKHLKTRLSSRGGLRHAKFDEAISVLR